MILKNAKVFLDGKFKISDIKLEGSQIIEISDAISPDQQDDIFDFKGKLILPGLIDIHTHGCVGFDFSSASVDGMKEMCRYYLSKGVTTVLATTMTNEYSLYQQAMRNIKELMELQKPLCTTGKESCNVSESRIIGINMEGPFLGVDKKGAHDKQYLMALSEAIFDELDLLSGNAVRLLDLDPRLENAIPFIKKYSKFKKISLAHTSCDYALAKEAAEAGATHVTHLFNAMNGLHHREPGLVGAVVDLPLNAEMICDGIHIAPPVIRLMFKAVSEKMVLISDSISATGMDDGNYELGGQQVFVENGKATLKDGTIAGSTTNVYDGMRNAIRFGVGLEQAILSATQIPAAAVGIDDRCGSIAVGKFADLVITDIDLNLEQVIMHGKMAD